MNLPTQYDWLAKEPGPKMLKEALALYGVQEKAGARSNPVILDWARDVGVTYHSDSVAWCGLFMAICAKRAGWPVVNNPLGARNWLNFGVPVAKPELGDVLVFWRGTRRGFKGHVGIYVGHTLSSYAVLGGNQSNSVSITWISKFRFLGARHPVWRDAEPANRRSVLLKSSGQLSTNEA
jgi:uncharacterized protein (TIGR02594 family)